MSVYDPYLNSYVDINDTGNICARMEFKSMCDRYIGNIRSLGYDLIVEDIYYDHNCRWVCSTIDRKDGRAYGLFCDNGTIHMAR